jgi:hypothetical protein
LGHLQDADLAQLQVVVHHGQVVHEKHETKYPRHHHPWIKIFHHDLQTLGHATGI